ncbi:LOW QUALITY PROTEIN: pleiotropic regulator 1 [Thalassophryne amazonica]|uniref:LOW QUALITY PROTEIN: pleiotropic regulator 1 n=1 Tax=Thalassophryne amazonica TaxID=390379 RepID=UPI0014716CB1|nr:LOW QUALITY PROTEIN: pleiotropic regulator 1 [Thalassophryne amazonica]
MTEDVQKHSVHTLVFRSLKRTHDMFVSDQASPVALDEQSHKLKMAVKLKSDYNAVLHMPVLKEGKDRVPQISNSIQVHQNYTQPVDDPEYLITGTYAYPSGPGVALTADTALHRNPSEAGVHSTALALPPSQVRQEASRTAASVAEIHRHVGGAERSSAVSLMEGGGTRNSLMRKAPVMPKPQWHPPWKLFRVISGHLGWVRSIAVEPGNQWFVTGSADRTIKIWDLASGKLKLSLTGHISTVRGVAVSDRSPYLFSCGEDKQVKCWDLEYNKVIRHYHGHLSAVYDLDLHPTLDVLMTCSRDATARVWDIRTKANVYTLTGHHNTVATVRCQSAEPQVVTGSHDSTIRLWDLIAGKTRTTLTNHKKSVRTLVLHPRQYTFASGSADNIKQWMFPEGNFIQNLSGPPAIIKHLAVNSDGVLVSGADMNHPLWDWRTGYNFQRIHAAVQPGSLDSESGIFACVFDRSESRLITAGADKTIKVYKEETPASEENHPINWKPEILKRKRF